MAVSREDRARARERWALAGDWYFGLMDAEATGDPLTLVTFYKSWADLNTEQTATAVLAARSSGCSWEQIGHALGVTKQGAWQMYRDHEKDPGPGQDRVTPA